MSACLARDETADLVTRKGEEHERAHLERLRRAGLEVEEIELDRGSADGLGAAAEGTLDAMRRGVDVIYQGVVLSAPWRGYADFLMESGKDYIVDMPGHADPVPQPLSAVPCTTPNGERAIISYRTGKAMKATPLTTVSMRLSSSPIAPAIVERRKELTRNPTASATHLIC